MPRGAQDPSRTYTCLGGLHASHSLLLAVLLPLHEGCSALLSPFARAFGAPSERELQGWRASFDRLKTTHATSRVRVFPIVDLGAGSLGAPTSARLTHLLQQKGWTHAHPAPTPPPLFAHEPFHNQMRFVVSRARTYAAWAKSQPQDADFLLLVEMLQDRQGKAAGIHVYVLEGSGQIAYVGWMNSHTLGAHLPETMEVVSE